MWPILDNRKVWLRLAGYCAGLSENRVDQKLMIGHGAPMENRHLMCIHHYTSFSDRPVQVCIKGLYLYCQPRIHKPWFLNRGGIPPIVISSHTEIVLSTLQR